MISWSLVVFCCLFSAVYGTNLTFPTGFKFGSASSAYQVEGAWNVSDKSESIWDRFCHEHPEATNRESADVACDSYRMWKDDVQAAVDLGLHYYRFSVSWTRLLPEGFSNKVSKDGVNYYNNLINELLHHGIEPVVTVYHWDLPQVLQDLGGWVNPYIAEWFADYARVVYTLYADRVKVWITINEPVMVCDLPYNTKLMAPAILDPDRANYICSKNLLIAHAKAWRIYDEEFRPKYNGRIGIDHHLTWLEPDTPADQNITDLVRDYHYGMYIYPIHSEAGGWPPAIEKIIAENSKKQGYLRSRLEPFTEEEKKLVQGTYDFLALNHYMNLVVRKPKDGEKVGPWPLSGVPDLGAVLAIRPGWDLLPNNFFTWYPESMRKLLSYLKSQYGDVEFMIMENGFGDTVSEIEDNKRTLYIKKYLEQILLAINEDKVNVTRYTVWSLTDNFEWHMGYSVKFGLYQIDFSDPQLRRIARKSARYFASVISNHAVVPIPFFCITGKMLCKTLT